MYKIEQTSKSWLKIKDTIIALHDIHLVLRQEDMHNTLILFKHAEKMYSVGDINPKVIFDAIEDMSRPVSSQEKGPK